MEEILFRELKKNHWYKNKFDLITKTPILKRPDVIPAHTDIFVRDIFYDGDEIRVEIIFFKGWKDYLIGQANELSGLY